MIQYRPEIDGLRAIAVLSVVIYHYFPSFLPGGFTGVDIFFVISGYLITSIIIREIREERFSVINFYKRRAVRIFPALILVLVASLAFGWYALLGDEYQSLGKHVFSGSFFTANLFYYDEVGYFDDDSELKPLLHLWSLGVEEQFYILWPLLLLVLWRIPRHMFALVITVVASFVASVLILRWDQPAAFYLPVFRFWELGIGGLVAVSNFGRAYSRIAALPLLGLALLLVGFWLISTGPSFPGYWALLPVSGALLLILVPCWLTTNKIMVGLGLISYPLYLWHWPLISLTRLIEGVEPSTEIKLILMVAALLLAWLTFIFIEKPIRFGEVLGNNSAGILTLVLLITGGFGATVWSQQGFADRSWVKLLDQNQNELQRTPAKERACLDFLEVDAVSFHYCRVTDIGADETVMIIGDSHAHVAYPGLADGFASQGFNTLMLANSSCPPLLGSPSGRTEEQIAQCDRMLEELLSFVATRADNELVIMFTRGPVYWTGVEPSMSPAKAATSTPFMNLEAYQTGLQRTFEFLNRHGKRVLYVLENPELHVHPKSCEQRPFRSEAIDCDLSPKN